MLVLLDMRFHWWDAAILFVLWLAQFLVAAWRDEITIMYLAWAVLLVIAWIWRRPTAPGIFWRLVRSKPGEARRRQKKTSPAEGARLEELGTKRIFEAPSNV